MNPLISIIITCYNLGEFLGETIDSVQTQSYNNFEIIIVDDGSADPYTIQFLNSFSAKNTRIVSQKNSGVSVARNFGASLAKGDYLLFLDGDDKLATEYLTKVVSAVEKDPFLEYIYCDLLEFGQTKAIRKIGNLSLQTQILYNIPHSSGVISRALWKKSGGFDEQFVKGWEDWDFGIRLIGLNIRAHKIEEPLFLYRIRNNSRDKIANKNSQEELEQMIFSKNLRSYLKFYSKPISLLREYEILKKENARFEEFKKELYNSKSYKLGSFILAPIKFIKKKIKEGKRNA